MSAENYIESQIRMVGQCVTEEVKHYIIESGSYIRELESEKAELIEFIKNIPSLKPKDEWKEWATILNKFEEK